MDRLTTLARLSSLAPSLRARGVTALYLYGSVARDDAGPESDIDVFVDFDVAVPRRLSEFVAPYLVIEKAFPGVSIGYSDRSGLSRHVRAHVERDAIRVF